MLTFPYQRWRPTAEADGNIIYFESSQKKVVKKQSIVNFDLVIVLD